MTEQEQKDAALGKYGRLKDEIVELRDKRNKAIRLIDDFLQRIKADIGGTYADYDAHELDIMMVRLNVSHLELMSRVLASNMVADLAEKPKYRVKKVTDLA